MFTINLNRTALFLVALLFSAGFPQTGWRHSDYKSTTYKNFRDNPLFSQTIDFTRIDYPLLNAAIFFATNEARVENGRKPLPFALELERSAYLHAKSMVEQNFFSHENPRDKERKTVEHRARLAGIKNPFVAENIATRSGIVYEPNTPFYLINAEQGTFSYTSGGPIIPNHTYLSFAEAIVKQWLDSPGHRRNLLSKDALQLGCGAYFYRDVDFHNMPNFKAVQNFQLFREIVPGKATDRWP
jgi:uncharacterized protein YkwD